MTTTTRYRISIAASAGSKSNYITGVDASGQPIAWARLAGAGQWSRGEAEAIAQRLADYLAACQCQACRANPGLARKAAASVRIKPTTGGETYWRPRLPVKSQQATERPAAA